MSFASFAGQGSPARRCSGRPRALEIVAVVAAFFWFWPLAVAYLAWKFAGYPVPQGLAADLRRNARQAFGGAFGSWAPMRDQRWAGFEASSGNRAFDEYRRAEIERFEVERRKLDDERREFRAFVDELNGAKDRQEFDAFMARRRGNGATSA